MAEIDNLIESVTRMRNLARQLNAEWAHRTRRMGFKKAAYLNALDEIDKLLRPLADDYDNRGRGTPPPAANAAGWPTAS